MFGFAERWDANPVLIGAHLCFKGVFARQTLAFWCTKLLPMIEQSNNGAGDGQSENLNPRDGITAFRLIKEIQIGHLREALHA